MRHRVIVIATLIGLAFLLSPGITTAQAAIGATNNRATLKFPESVTFSVDLKSDAVINQVVLEYGVQKMTCGTIVSRVFTQFTPSTNVGAKWAWEMKKTGSEPPGAIMWWQWRVTNAAGKEFVTDRQTVTWLDSQHPWQNYSGELVNLHWYSGDRVFASQLHDAAIKALRDLTQNTGLESDAPPDLYIYATTQEMRDAVFYVPSWTGGRAYSDYNIVIVGIAPNQMDWGKSAIVHELTHVLHRRSTFTCLGDTPTWLTEGLAGYGEGGRSPESMRRLQTAIANNTLISVRTLSSSFPEDPVKVDLSYTESYSVVNFLIGEYGKDKFMTLLRALQTGTAIDDALRATYGFDTDGLEDAWRAKIGAKPRSAARLIPTATPTVVPTFAPIAGWQFPTRTPTQVPPTAAPTTVTPAPGTTPVPDTSSVPSLLLLLLCGFCLIAVVVIVIFVVVIVIVLAERQQRMKP